MDQITIPEEWLEKLLKLVSETENDYENGYKYASFQKLYDHISSAETIIKMK